MKLHFWICIPAAFCLTSGLFLDWVRGVNAQKATPALPAVASTQGEE